jgi:hypothetical protein
LGGLDELERHRDSGDAEAGAFRDRLSEPDGDDGGLEAVASTLSTRTLRMWERSRCWAEGFAAS